MFNCAEAIQCGHCDRAECCGIIPFSQSLYNRMLDKQQVSVIETVLLPGFIIPVTEDTFCVFKDRTTHKCIIYDSRPKLCQLYGLTQGLLCPVFRPDGIRRSRPERRAMKRKSDNWVPKKIRQLSETASALSDADRDTFIQSKEHEWLNLLLSDSVSNGKSLIIK